MSASGSRMASPWCRKAPEVLAAKAPVEFTFELLDARGKPRAEMALSMGILGYKEFVNSDRGVVAHLHRSGAVSMAAPVKANPNIGARPDSAMKDKPGMSIHSDSLPDVVSLPYGIRSAGEHRILGQMKQAAIVKTGAFNRPKTAKRRTRSHAETPLPHRCGAVQNPKEIRATGKGGNYPSPFEPTGVICSSCQMRLYRD